MGRNQTGGFFEPGKPLPLDIREEILDLLNSMNKVSRAIFVTRSCVSKQKVGQAVGPEG